MARLALGSTPFAALVALVALAVLLGSPARCASAGGRVAGLEDPLDDEVGTVILLHGLIRSSRSMASLETALAERGYRVVNFDYPSTEIPIAEVSSRLARTLAECCTEARGPVHFVTHSLGGIVVRFHLDRTAPARLGRVVMLSPPNNGSEVVDVLKEYEVFRAGIGPAALELSTEEQSVPKSLGPVEFELGVITGDRSINPLFSWRIPGADDGQVSVEGARIEGMADFLILPATHTFIMNDPEAIAQTLHFLEHGSFDRRTPRP